MKKNNLIIKLQNLTGATASEIAVALLLLSGLIVGISIKKYYYTSENSSNKAAVSYYDILDSLAETQKTTYTGSDIAGNEIKALKEKDTIVKKKEVFAKSKKKSLPDGKINLNTASKLELMKLPGVGEKTAQKIIQYRKNNKFNKIEDIENVKGIGPKKFENMKKYLQI